MEQIPEFENSDRRSRITKLAEKAKKLLKIGMIASIGVSSSAGSNTKESTKNMDRLNEYPVEHFDQKAHGVLSFEEFISSEEYKDRVEAMNKEVGIVSRLLSEYENKIDKIKTNKSTYKQSEENLNKHILYLEEQIHSLKESYKEVVEDLKDVEKSAYGIYLAHKKSTHLPYDTEHLWLEKNISSPEYRKKLEGEFGSKTDSVLDARKQRLSDKNYKVVRGFNAHGDTHAFYDPNSEEVTFPSISEDGLGIHEFTHDMTQGDDLLSEKAKELYTESYDPSQLTPDELGHAFKNLIDNGSQYFNNPTERDARKKALEYDMAKLGVKTYGEEFTDDHYKKLLILQKEGLLNPSASEFLRMTKPEYFKKIMNEIAEQKIVSDDDQNNKA